MKVSPLLKQSSSMLMLPLLVLSLGSLVKATINRILSDDKNVLLCTSNGPWKEQHTQAVVNAGGVVEWSHEESRLASVTVPDGTKIETFASLLPSSISCDLDEIVQWSTNPSFSYATDDFENGKGSDTIPDDVYDASSYIDLDNEPMYSYQWNMHSINAEDAWAAGCTGEGARIAIIDGGIDPTHPDLAANMDTSCSMSFTQGLPYNSDTGSFWHGMHVAGIAAASNDESGQVIGVAPDASIVSVKALHGGSGTFGAVIGGILYSSDPASFGMSQCKKVDIINLSLGASFEIHDDNKERLIAFLNKAVTFAASKGVLVVASAGNDGVDLGQAIDLTKVPAESGSAIAISATGPTDVFGYLTGTPGDPRAIASYSNYGEGAIFLAAPGGEISPAATVTVNDGPASLLGRVLVAEIALFTPLPSGETGNVILWVDSSDTTGDIHDACENAGPANANEIAGNIVLIHRGACSFLWKVDQAYSVGATAVIISNNRDGSPPRMGPSTTPPSSPIPAVSIGKDDGEAIEAALLTVSVVSVTLQYNPFAIYDSVLSACRIGWCYASGTSMASPIVAGVAALIKGRNPGISLGALKTALMRAADDEGKTGVDQYYGHGFINAAKACENSA